MSRLANTCSLKSRKIPPKFPQAPNPSILYHFFPWVFGVGGGTRWLQPCGCQGHSGSSSRSGPRTLSASVQVQRRRSGLRRREGAAGRCCSRLLGMRQLALPLQGLCVVDPEPTPPGFGLRPFLGAFLRLTSGQASGGPQV